MSEWWYKLCQGFSPYISYYPRMIWDTHRECVDGGSSLVTKTSYDHSAWAHMYSMVVFFFFKGPLHESRRMVQRHWPLGMWRNRVPMRSLQIVLTYKAPRHLGIMVPEGACLPTPLHLIFIPQERPLSVPHWWSESVGGHWPEGLLSSSLFPLDFPALGCSPCSVAACFSM